MGSVFYSFQQNKSYNHKKGQSKMKNIFFLVIAGIFILSACGAEGGIEIQNAWARPATQGGNGAVYFLIRNQSSNADEITGAASDAAETAELHKSMMVGDVMQMQKQESVPLEARAEVEFKPGGLHIMLINLKQDLQVNDEIEVVLHFKNSDDITLKVPVKDKAPEGNHMDMNN
jgi:hypothetical protein